MQDPHQPPEPKPSRQMWGLDPTTGKAIKQRMMDAFHERRCFCCGEPIHRYLCFGIDMRSALTRTSPVPPSHASCLEEVAAGGFLQVSWPEIAIIWSTLSFEVQSTHTGVLFLLGEPVSIDWLKPGGSRPNMEEAYLAISNGLPPLVEAVLAEGSEKDQEQLTFTAMLLTRFLPVKRSGGN